MKVFISHKEDDSVQALDIQKTLKSSGVDAYLDILDNTLIKEGAALTKHIKDNLNDCTDLLVVLSEKTKESWWVPFEIGMASQKDFPIVNYLKSGIVLPEYLEYWPRLKQLSDLYKYIAARNEATQIVEKTIGFSASARTRTERFYDVLKRSL